MSQPRSFFIETDGAGVLIYDVMEMTWVEAYPEDRVAIYVAVWTETLLVRTRVTRELEQRRGLMTMGFLHKEGTTWYITDSPNPINKAS